MDINKHKFAIDKKRVHLLKMNAKNGWLLMIIQKVTVLNKYGLHARPSSCLAQTATHYQSEITLRKDDMEVNCKSIMGLMMLAAECGTEIEMIVEGPDEETAARELKQLFERKFRSAYSEEWLEEHGDSY